MKRHRLCLIFVLLGASALSGCGLLVPDIKEIWDKDIPADPSTNSPKVSGAAQIEYEIEEKIYCELKFAVQEAQHYYITQGAVVQKGLFPPNWAAQVALSLEVDETSALNPGVTLNRVLPNAVSVFGAGTSGSVTTAQSFSLGFGGTASSTSTRIDRFNPYWSIADLLKPIKPNSSCYPENDPFRRLGITPASSSPLLIESDLGIKDWLIGAMFVDEIIPSTPQPAAGAKASTGRSGGGGNSGGQTQGGGAKPESISIEIKFVIVTSGNVTPTWKLVRVSINSGNSSLFGTGRTRTHDLIITIGPNTQQTNDSHLAAQIGNAVGNANRALMTSP
jgi:hypothetical protein